MNDADEIKKRRKAEQNTSRPSFLYIFQVVIWKNVFIVGRVVGSQNYFGYETR